MPSTETDEPLPIEVRSADGTTLTAWIAGSGPPLVLVHGTLTDHAGFDSFVAALGGALTTVAVDRRGYGASGDGSGYSIEREFEDVAAVVDAVAARTSRAVALFGHSYGANCVLGGATLTDNVGHLIVYEPSLGLRYPPGAVAAMDDALAGGQRETVLLAALAPLELSADDIEALRSGPRWPMLLDGAPNAPREARTEDGWDAGYAPFAGVTAPTLFLDGDQSPSDLRALTRQAAEAIPGAEVAVLEGHAHLAHRADPGLLAGIVRRFCGAEPSPSDAPAPRNAAGEAGS